ncbi:Na+/H+ antiporter NhaA [soil metagenome]
MTRRASSPFREFFVSEAAGGVVLMLAAVLAMLAANLGSTAHEYEALLHFATGPVLSPALGPMTVHLWINDGAMSLFFLLVGLEIRREFVGGELSTWAQRRLPIVAAATGMIVPAILYLAVTHGNPALRPGWAIPAATDIAFAVGIVALLGKRVPATLKLFLVAVAIVDDIGAVAIIAVAYTARIDLAALAGAVAVGGAILAMGKFGIRAIWPYAIAFALLWWLVLASGVHATVAGVATAMLIPPATGQKLEHILNPWVAFLIVPLFGFANAGVSLSGVSLETLTAPLVLGVALGLFLGKQAGILGGIALAHKLGIARAPHGATLAQLYGVALLAGIGFTMSLFIGALAFPTRPDLAETLKLGVLGGSLLSAIAGFLVLRLASRS